MEELIGPAIIALIVVVFIGGITWAVTASRQAEIDCMSRGGMYLEGVCVRGQIVDLNKPAG